MTEREWLAEAVAEAEWLGCSSMEGMPYNLDYCFGRCGVLFAIACCRSVWHLLPDDPGRAAVLTAEGYADGAATRAALEAAEQRAWEAGELMLGSMPDLGWKGSPAWHAIWATASFTGATSGRRPLSGAAYHVRHAVAWEKAPAADQRAERDQLMKLEAARQWGLVRDIFGNPFRKVALAPSVLQWNAGRVKRLAEEAYQGRLLPSGHLDPRQLEALGDALEQAGGDAELVRHLRESGSHAKGCWAVDFLTGRQ